MVDEQPGPPGGNVWVRTPECYYNPKLTICPIDEISGLWVFPGLKEPEPNSVRACGNRIFGLPEEEVLSAGYIQVPRVLLHARVAKLWFGHAKPIRGECRMGNKFIWSCSFVEIIWNRMRQGRTDRSIHCG